MSKIDLGDVLGLRQRYIDQAKAQPHLSLRYVFVLANGPVQPDILVVGDVPTDVDEEINLAFSGALSAYMHQLFQG